MTAKIDVHQHAIPERYLQLLETHGIAQAGGRPLPEWSAPGALDLMSAVGTSAAILSISTPGVAFLAEDPDAAAAAARDVNDECAAVTTSNPERFGFFATLPMPNEQASLAEARHAIEHLGAAGVTMLANSAGVYLAHDSKANADLFGYLDERRAVVFIHPADLPAPPVDGIPPFATDFLLDTTRAAYLLVRNGIRQQYPNIRFLLSHGGGMVPYISHRMAVSIMNDTGRNLADILGELSSFYFDTALSSSPAALPTLLAFAQPGHVLFGSDWPFAPEAAAVYFAAGLAGYDMADEVRDGIHRHNALRLFPQFGAAAPLARGSMPARARNHVRQAVARRIVSALGQGGNS